MSLKRFPFFVGLFFLAFFAAALGAEELNVYFKTTPRIELLRPFHDPADLALLVTETDGRPLEQGSVDIRLDAPKPGSIFSTDFPLVEGTSLSEMRLPLRQGKANWKLLLPVRGEYRLSVDILTNDGRRASKVFNFTVRENEKKWLALSALSIALFLLGFTAGRVFSGSRTAAAALTALALLLAPVAITRAQEDKLDGKATLQVEPATVGKLTLVRWSRGHDPGPAPSTALLTLTIEHLEKDKIAFAIDRVPVAREFSVKFHFTDGARYRVRTLAQVSGESPLRNEQVVDVTGVEAPTRATAPALLLFVGLIALGLGAGRWSKRHQTSV